MTAIMQAAQRHRRKKEKERPGNIIRERLEAETMDSLAKQLKYTFENPDWLDSYYKGSAPFDKHNL